LKLIVVESPGKISKISQYAGNEFVVKASVGHCIDLPEHTLGVDLKNNFAPSYKTIKGKADVLKGIKATASKVDEVYLATDNDREGEAIAWLIANYLPKKTVIKRIIFNEITKSAIKSAIDNPTELDEDKFHAQQARRILDRLVGYRVSPILPKGQSAGRVQSVALRMIVDRQREIENFIPKEYWSIHADFETPKKEQFTAKLEHKDDIENEESAQEIVDYLGKHEFGKVKSVEKKERKESAYPPFTTSSMQISASAAFGFIPSLTMTLAQKLYESGLITYHRSDSVAIAQEALHSAREVISSKYGNSYLPDKPLYYKTKQTANVQGAHECIRPSNPALTPDEAHLHGNEKKLYELIWRRFIACQMTNALFDTISVKVAIGKYIFAANGKTKKFDGYTKVWIYSSAKDVLLPDIEEGDEEKILKIDPQQHFTKPPPRYNDASFVKALEENGVGRPSTYATIIKTLLDRSYVEKDGKNLKPTEIGYSVSDFLVDNFPELMDIGFTANMETELDEIENGNKVWQSVLEVFWDGLKQRISEAKVKKKEDAITDFKCDLCGRPLANRMSKWGAFLGCSGYKDKEDSCAAIYTIGEHGEPVLKVKKKHEYMDNVECPCGGKVIIRTNKKDGNKFGGCEKFPHCRNIFDMDGTLKPASPNKKWKKWTKKPKKAAKKKTAKKKASKKSKKAKK